MEMVKKIAIAIMIAVLLVWLSCGEAKENKEFREMIEAGWEQIQEQVNRHMLSGLIMAIECELYRIYVNPIQWRMLPLFNKRGVAELLRRYCAKKRNIFDRYLIIYIHDGYSGKQLARYDIEGLKVY